MTIKATKLDELLAKHNLLETCTSESCRPKVLNIRPKKSDKWVVKKMGKVVSDVFTDKEKAINESLKYELSEVVRYE